MIKPRDPQPKKLTRSLLAIAALAMLAASGSLTAQARISRTWSANPSANAPATSADAREVHAALAAQRIVHRSKPAARPRHATPAPSTPAAPKAQVASPHHSAPARSERSLVRIKPPSPTHHPLGGPTGWPALNRAIARLPDADARHADWVVSNRYGHYGTTDWYRHIIYVSPSTPTDLLFSVAAHEWSHAIQVADYGDDVNAAVNAINAQFGGGGSTGLRGIENAADCMAREQGATWTMYTSCQDSRWRKLARRLLNGKQI